MDSWYFNAILYRQRPVKEQQFWHSWASFWSNSGHFSAIFIDFSRGSHLVVRICPVLRNFVCLSSGPVNHHWLFVYSLNGRYGRSHVKMSIFCLTFRKNHVCLHSTEKRIVHSGMLSVDLITSEISSILSAARSWEFSMSSRGLAKYPLNFRPYSSRSLFSGLDQANVWLSPVYTSLLPIIYSVSL
jgi:hypothetical protein